MLDKVPPYRCAIYTRVSTTMQAEVEYNSCEAQRDKILAFIESQEDMETFREYSDPGCSGGDLDRPGLKTLLGDIESGQIDLVLTYKIDRLTRSSKDFYALIEIFEKKNVSFISVTERFDTSSPSGRLLRNVMLTFAQFEREMIAERIKDKLQQRAEKGMWHGGTIPFGYKTIDKKLVINKKEAEIVKQLFEHFVLTGSPFETAKFARENNIGNSLIKVPMSQSGIYHLLSNAVYVGGIKWYDKVYPGQHTPIISLKDASIAGQENESGEMAARIRRTDLTPAPPALNTEFAKAKTWTWPGSNRRPPHCERGALPAELQARKLHTNFLNQNKMFLSHPSKKVRLSPEALA